MNRIPYLGVLLVLLVSSTATGDEIRIQSGQFDLHLGIEDSPVAGPLILTGDRGFTFQSFQSFDITFLGHDCRPEIYGLRCVPGFAATIAVALAPPGTAMLDGVTYPVTGQMWLQLNAFSGIVLPALAPTATATGMFSVADFFNQFPYAGGTAAFIGSGTVTLSLVRNETFPEIWRIDHAHYDFTAVPEPATLLLFIGGIGAIAGRRLHARKRKVSRHN